MPPALSRSTSRILRIGNLCPGMPSSSQKELMPCRFEDHPTVPVTSVHSLVAIARNGWSRSIGKPGRNQLEQVVAITRCAHAYATALASGRRDGKGGLSRRTVHHMHRVLKQALGQAVI